MRRPAGGSEKSTNVSIGSFRSASFVLCFLDEDDDENIEDDEENNEDGDEDEDEIGLSCSTIFCLFPFATTNTARKSKRKRKKEKKEEKKEKTRKEETEELSE